MDRRKANIHIQQISQEGDIYPTLVQIKNWSWTLWFLNMSTCLPFERWIMLFWNTIHIFWNALHKMVIHFFSLSQHQWNFFTFMQSMKTISFQFETRNKSFFLKLIKSVLNPFISHVLLFKHCPPIHLSQLYSHLNVICMSQ
jgi:hypothetical protein